MDVHLHELVPCAQEEGLGINYDFILQELRKDKAFRKHLETLPDARYALKQRVKNAKKDAAGSVAAGAAAGAVVRRTGWNNRHEFSPEEVKFIMDLYGDMLRAHPLRAATATAEHPSIKAHPTLGTLRITQIT